MRFRGNDGLTYVTCGTSIFLPERHPRAGGDPVLLDSVSSLRPAVRGPDFLRQRPAKKYLT
ncbi:hypothetical protein KL86DPRO_11922 [uncultured delta proteobacterium]|uniref:Uncharacterized protein n=1 Tax=uncultured delta proteobacterium TaxID=34034 RepID=A0A212JPI8_9DELT|nr:hypothetical protein KL86DPRO_11922 [uncultured delta proteobacterium]